MLTCFIENRPILNITQKNEVMTSASTVTGIERVKALYITKQTIYYMPKFTESFAKNLKLLYLASSKLQSISREDLRQFPNLIRFSVWNNEILFLSFDLFELTPKLESIEVNWNRLEFVGEGIFDSLTNLGYISMGQSGCIDFSAEPKNHPQTFVVLKSKLLEQCKA